MKTEPNLERMIEIALLMLSALGCDTSLFKILFDPDELERVQKFIADLKEEQ